MNSRPQPASKLPPVFAWVAALAIFQACAIEPGRAAETNAVIPYKTIDDLWQVADTVDPAKLEIHLFISSTNKAVQASNISLTIQSAKKGTMPVQLGTDGRILKFPHEQELRGENPSILANQPKGSISLMITLQLPPSDELTFRYKRLGDGVAEMNKVIKAQAGMLSLLAPKAQGVVFLFPKASAGKAKVEIGAAAGTKEYKADKDGVIELKMDKKLLAENPEVTVSEKPQYIAPDFE